MRRDKSYNFKAKTIIAQLCREPAMPEDWITNRVTAASKNNQLVSQEMADKLEDLLRNTFCESLVTAGQIGKLANVLLDDLNLSADGSKSET